MSSGNLTVYPIPETQSRFRKKGDYKKNQTEELPVPLSDERFPFLKYQPAREGAKKEDPDHKPRVVSDDSMIDIFDLPDNSFLQDATIDLKEIQPFLEYSKKVAQFDLEWIGADGGEAKGDGTDVIVAIGIKNQGKHYAQCRKDRTEKQLIEWFWKQLAKLKEVRGVHTLAGQSIYGFFRGEGEARKEVSVDLRMLYERSKFHGLEDLCPWRPVTEGKYTTHKWLNAIVNGKPLEVPAWECDDYQLIDTYPQVVSYDFLVSKLPDYSLKSAVIGFGLREERRLEIGDRVYEFWEKGDTETILEYLKQDLDDTEALWNFLLPQKYFMKSYMDWDLKRITTTGTGSWWLQFYRHKTKETIPRTKKCGYSGALTFYKSGIYRNCAKFDYSGLYPSIMLTWLISHKWDKDMFLLKALKFLISYRKSIKKTQAFKDYEAGIESIEGTDAYGQQLTAKILANSLYGAIALVDPYAAAAVTSYGRELARFMITWLTERGMDIHGCFTGETEVLTSEGNKRIDSLLNRTTLVLNNNRDWVPVEFKSYGTQRIYNLYLKKGRKKKVIRTTGNHRWILANGEIKTTVELTSRKSLKTSYDKNSRIKFDRIENHLANRPDTNNADYRLGVVHGVVYGDGQRRSDNRNIEEGKYSVHRYGHFIQLCEDKRYLYGELKKAANDGSITLYDPIVENIKCESFRVTLRSDFILKNLPETKSRSYLLGFIRGLLATDGNVSGKDGCPDISGQKDTIEFLNEIAWLVGIEPSRINISNKAGRITEIRGRQCIQKKDTYRIFFSKNSMVADDFLRYFHQNKWINSLTGGSKVNWVVDEIIMTEEFEEVFCCEEPITHTFTLTDGVICGNCDTDGVLLNFKNDNFETDEERHNAFKKLEEELNAALPGETYAEYEEYIPFVFIPPNTNNKKKAAKKLADKLSTIDCYDEHEVDPNNLNPGLSKNYIYFVKKAEGKFKQVFKGKFKKRDRSFLETKFVLNMIDKMFYEGDEKAKEYAITTRIQIGQGIFPVENLRKTELVRSNAKTLPCFGYELGEKYRLHYTWRGHYLGKKKFYKVCIPTDNPEESYDPDLYLYDFCKIMDQFSNINLPPYHKNIVKSERPGSKSHSELCDRYGANFLTETPEPLPEGASVSTRKI